ncbi:MAG: tetratricopeptide repeat protein, partial [Saprospiraceae bacterium]
RSLDNISQLWSTHYWAGKIDANDTGLYRPLTLTTYALQYSMHGQNATPYHILNILLHALACFALIRLIALLFNDIRLTALSGLFFAIHPIHTEAVCGVVGRAEILSAIFIITAGISYHHWRKNGQVKWLAALALSTLGAIASKEHGFMLFAILGLQEALYVFTSKKYQFNQKRFWSAMAVVIAISIILWMIRSAVTGPAVPHEQWLVVSTGDRMATATRTIAEYVGMHIVPLKLSADYWTDEVNIVGWESIGVIISFLILAAVLALAVWKRRELSSFSWGILFFFLTLAPVSNFFFAAGFLKAERVLYIPSIGLITAMAGILAWLLNQKKFKIAAIVLIVALAGLFIFKTITRQPDWKNNYTLAQATVETSPNSPRFNDMLGLELRKQERHEEAMVYFEKAVQGNPNHVPALVNLATSYKNLGKNAEAAQLLEKALRTDEGTMATYVNLMSVYRAMENYDKNLEIAQLAIARFPQSAAVLWNAANAYQLKNNMQMANELRAKAVAIDPSMAE